MIRQIVHFAENPTCGTTSCFSKITSQWRGSSSGRRCVAEHPAKADEASGTSGMKSWQRRIEPFVLDGWWVECYDRNVGWAIDREKSILIRITRIG